MSKRKVEKSKLHNQLIPVTVLVITFVAIMASFGIRMISEAKERVSTDYISDVNEISQMYNQQLYAVNTIAGLVVDETSAAETITDDENLKILETAVKVQGIKNVYLITPDLNGLDAYGNRYEQIDSLPHIKEILNYKDGKCRFIPGEDGKQRLYMCKGVVSNNTVKGYVILEYESRLMETLLENPKFTARKTFALVTAKGDIVETIGKSTSFCEVGDNIIVKANGFNFSDSTYAHFKQSISDSRSGSSQIEYKGNSKYLYYSPVDNCKAVVLMAVDYADVERSFNKVSKTIRTMIIAIGITVLVFLAVLAGVALFNKARYSLESVDLQNKADTDQLTDLYNKMATERMIKEYIEGEGKNSTSMLFLIDVDNFKKINDTMGHAFGDKVLSQLGHQIRAWFRVNDIVGRIGGDEFMIFVKDIKNPSVIEKEGARIMQFFEGFSVGEYTKYSPTASVGGAVYPNDASDFESLYKAADIAVYEAKKEGKNRVAFYGKLSEKEKPDNIKESE